MSEEKKPELQGIIAIMTTSEGHVAATSADFERQGYGGFKLWEAQRMRAGDSVKRKAVMAYVGDFVGKHLRSYTVENIIEDLVQHGKWRVTYRAIGYPDDVADAIARY